CEHLMLHIGRCWLLPPGHLGQCFFGTQLASQCGKIEPPKRLDGYRTLGIPENVSRVELAGRGGVEQRSHVISLGLALARYEIARIVEDNRLAQKAANHREVKVLIKSGYRHLPGCECIVTDAEHGEPGTAPVDGTAPAIQRVAMPLEISPGLRC